MAAPVIRITSVEVLFERPNGVTTHLDTSSGPMDVTMTYGQYRSIFNQIADNGSAVLDSGAEST